MRFVALPLAIIGVLGAAPAWSQSPGRPAAVEKAYITIFPGDSTDVDHVLALQQGIEMVLCRAGVKPTERSDPTSELKLAAQLSKAQFGPDKERRQIVRECELTEASITLPGGTQVSVPGLALSGRSTMPGRGERMAGESFFLACGATFARGALDALKSEIKLSGARCDEPAAAPKPAARKKK